MIIYMIIEFITRQIHPHPDQNHLKKLIMQVSFQIKLYHTVVHLPTAAVMWTIVQKNVKDLHPPIPPPLSAGDSCRIFSLNRNSTIHLPYLAFVCLSVCLLVCLSVCPFVIKDNHSCHHWISRHYTLKHSQGSQPSSLWDLFWMQTQLFSIYVHWTIAHCCTIFLGHLGIEI